MTTHVTSRMRWSVLGTLAALAIGLTGMPASALGPGAPPDIKYVGMIIMITDDGAPRLRAELEVEIPGGAVPLNVASVTVTVPAPDGRTSSIPLGRNDLYPMRDYNLDLGTESGFSGGVFPAGTYVFTVTDTAGGTTTVTDNLGATTGLAAASSLTVSGAVPVSGQPGQPPTYLLNLATTPTPTVSWTPPAGALNQRLRIRGGFQDQNLFSRYTNDGTTSTMTLPAGIMVLGRRYVVQLDAFDHANPFGCSATPPCTNTNVRARRRIELITPGPEIFLTFNSGTYSAGQTLDVTTRVYNTGPTVTVDALAWIGLPTGAVMKILDVDDLVIPTNLAGDFYNGTIGFSYTFNGTEPSGNYVVGLRLIDPDTGETVALATQTFRK